VLDGTFRTGNANSLSYHVKKSADSDTPQQIKLYGNYSLDEGHNLVFTLNKWNNQVEANRLVIKGDLLSAQDDGLSFSVATKDASGKGKVYILNLSGAWRLDPQNRITFDVSREDRRKDALILQGTWQVNDTNQLVYTCAKKSSLAFKGHWDITKKHRLSYVLNKDINSGFDFSGTWRLRDKIGLFFEVPFKDKRPQRIAFGATCSLGPNNTLEVRFKRGRQMSADINLKLSRKILKGSGEAFISALKGGREVSLAAGVGFRW
jgi:hypothetical protein